MGDKSSATSLLFSCSVYKVFLLVCICMSVIKTWANSFSFLFFYLFYHGWCWNSDRWSGFLFQQYVNNRFCVFKSLGFTIRNFLGFSEIFRFFFISINLTKLRLFIFFILCHLLFLFYFVILLICYLCLLFLYCNSYYFSNNLLC